MRYVIGYKIIYLMLLVGNIIDTLNAIAFHNVKPIFNIDDITSWHLTSSTLFLLVNGFIATKLLQKKVSTATLNLERFFSIGRMIAILSIALFVGMYVAQFFSPVLRVFWMPLISFAGYLKEISTFTQQQSINYFIPILCSFILTLEIYYFVLLSRNKDELRKNISPQKPEEMATT